MRKRRRRAQEALKKALQRFAMKHEFQPEMKEIYITKQKGEFNHE